MSTVDLVDGGCDRVPTADVEGEGVRTYPGLRGDGLAGQHTRVLLTTGDAHGRTGSRETTGDRLAEPACCTCDQDHLARELVGHRTAPSEWRFNTSRAMVRRCNSLGPSAICRARVIA